MKTEERLKRKKEKRVSEREEEKCRFTLCIQETKVAVQEYRFQIYGTEDNRTHEKPSF